MKILILNDSFPSNSVSSPGIVALNLAKELLGLGHEIQVVTTDQRKDKEGQALFEGMRVHTIYSNYHPRWQAYLSLKNSNISRRVKEIIAEFNPDIVHAHNIHYHLSYESLKIAKLSGAKVFLTAHDVMLFNYGKLFSGIDKTGGSVNPSNSYKVSYLDQLISFKRRYNPFRNITIKKYLLYVDKIFAVSQALKNALNDNGIYNVTVINNGINANDWFVSDKDLAEFKDRNNLRDKKLILFGGRLGNAKGGEKILLAMKEIIQKEPQAFLLAAGINKDDKYAKWMAARSKDLGISNHIIFLGWLNGRELKSAFFASEVIVVPSICFDSFPTVALEAMAASKPVVGSYFGGLSEIVVDEKTGFIINPYNIESMADKISLLLSDKGIAENLGLAGRKRVEEDFTLKRQVDETLSFYLGQNDNIKTG